MSAAPVEIMPREQAIALVERYAAQQAEDVFQLIPQDSERAVLAMHLEEAADILKRDTAGAVIQSPQEEAALVALQGRAYRVELAIAALRKRLVKPLQDEVKAINGLLGTDSMPGGLVFGPLLARMGKGGDADRRQAAWRAAERARIARERETAQAAEIEAARLQEEARVRAATAATEEAKAAAEADAVMAELLQQRAELSAPRAQVRGVKTEDGTKSYHEEWTFEVVKPEDVPRQYLMVNDAAIRAAVKPKNGVRQIPGVNIYPVERSRRGV